MRRSRYSEETPSFSRCAPCSRIPAKVPTPLEHPLLAARQGAKPVQKNVKFRRKFPLWVKANPELPSTSGANGAKFATRLL